MKLHIVAHSWLFAVVTRKIDAMGLDAEWDGIGSATFREPGGGSDEGNSTGQPGARLSDKDGNGGRPTLVIRAGISPTMQATLPIKAQWWVAASSHRHPVKVVVLVKVSADTSTIHIEKWTEAPPP